MNTAVKAHWDIRSEYSQQVGLALARSFDNRIIRTMCQAARAAANLSGAGLTAPAAPILQQSAGGTLAAATHFVKITYVSDVGETLPSIEASLNALSQPDKNAQRWINNRLGSYVPAGLAKADDDDYMREVRTAMDAMMRRIPGLSDKLPPVRDMFGDPVKVPGGYLPFGAAGDNAGARMLSPAAFSKQVDDPTRQEIANLQYGFTKAPKTWQGFPLQSFVNPQTKQDAYDRFQELHGQVQIGGQRMSEALSSLIKSDRYQSMSAPEGPQDQTNGRVLAVQKVIADYRSKAMAQTLQEYPAIKRASEMYKAQARLEQQAR